MRAAVCALVLLIAPGCVRFRTETRTERGPTLRTFERQGPPTPGGVRGEFEVAWPDATLRLKQFDYCRTDQVEEFDEDRITETTVPGGAASLGMGVTTVLAGAGLLVFLPSFSSEPDRSTLDAGGRYGAPPRDLARGLGIGLLVVGVPALAAAVWEFSGSGMRIDRRRREQVTTADEVRCNERPAAGTVELQTLKGPLPAVSSEEGVIRLNAQSLRGTSVTGATVGGEDVRLDAAEWDRLVAFVSCAQAAPVPDSAVLAAMDTAALRSRLDSARACVEVPGAPAEELISTLEQELSDRRGPQGAPPGPRIESFSDAVSTYNPTLRFPPDDVARLQSPESLKGLAIIVRGKLVDFLEANIAVLDVSGANVWLYLDAERPWSQGLRADQELEAVGVVMGKQEVGALEAPLMRVIWLRPAPEVVPQGQENPPKP